MTWRSNGPDLRDVLRLGTVRWWKTDNGYGRITADDGEVLFAGFCSPAKHRPLELVSGQRGVSVWRGGFADHGQHAADEVRVIGETCPLPDEVLPALAQQPPTAEKPTRDEIQAAIAVLEQVGFDLTYNG